MNIKEVSKFDSSPRYQTTHLRGGFVLRGDRKQFARIIFSLIVAILFGEREVFIDILGGKLNT